jgi:hypothetical protein
MKIAQTVSIMELRPNSRTPKTATLMHYGVKGMHWGVRRTKEELRYNKESVLASVNRKELKVTTANGIKVHTLSGHAGDRAAERKISAKEIVDAVTNPLHIKGVTYNEDGKPSQQFIGKYVTVAVNPETGIGTTLWPTGTRTRKKYSEKEN